MLLPPPPPPHATSTTITSTLTFTGLQDARRRSEHRAVALPRDAARGARKAMRRVAEALCARRREDIRGPAAPPRRRPAERISRQQISRWQGATGRSMSVVKAARCRRRAQASGSSTPSPPMTNRSSVASVAAASSNPHRRTAQPAALALPTRRGEPSGGTREGRGASRGVPESEHWRIVRAAYLLKGAPSRRGLRRWWSWCGRRIHRRAITRRAGRCTR